MKTDVLRLGDTRRRAEYISRAADIIKAGGVVAFPTETVYGLGGGAFSDEACGLIYMLKGRPGDNPLIVHISLDYDPAGLAEVNGAAEKLMEAFWPGPLTVVMPKRSSVPDGVTAGLRTVAVRQPSHPAAQELLREAGPIAAPSANMSGRPSPTSAGHVIEDMGGKIPLILDGGPCQIGLESTVVTVFGAPRLLRPGAVTAAELEEVLGERVQIDPSVVGTSVQRAESPGMKYRHYAPDTPVTAVFFRNGCDREISLQNLKTLAVSHCAAVVCFDEEIVFFEGLPALSYGSEADAASQAKGLFDALRKIDKLDCPKAYVRCPEPEGIGLAVWNRLSKAAGYNSVII